jgi:hypothetical protein
MFNARGTRGTEIAMLPHPSMSFAWDEEVVRPTRVLVAVVLLALIVALGASGLIELTGHNRQVTVVAHHETPLPLDTAGR